jgi:hypothetical protein
MDFFELRIDSIVFKKNKEILLPANVKLFSLVTKSDVNVEWDSLLDQARATPEIDIRMQYLKSLARRVFSVRSFMDVANIQDGQMIYFGDTGYAVMSSNKIPNKFTWYLLAFESDASARTLAARFSSILDQPQFGSIMDELLKLAANPSTEVGVVLGKWALETCLTLMSKNGDDQLGVLMSSFNKWEHYQEGERKSVGVKDLSGNMLVSYTIRAKENVE